MKLTIGMSCYDDYDGVWFTIQSVLMYHQECLDDINFVVVDGNPQSEHGRSCEQLISKLKNRHGNNGLYVKNVSWSGTASRDYVFQYAKSPYVLCLDSHVQIVPGAIKKLIDYYDSNPDCKNLIQGPLLDSAGQLFATEMSRDWDYNMYGKWLLNPSRDRGDQEYEVEMMGLGLFSCVKKNWLGFNQNFRGFGGEEGYIHDKYKLAGHKTIAFPWLKWNHRFDRPNGVPYRNDYIDRIKNYFIGWNELGKSVDEIINYYSQENTTPGQERKAISAADLTQLSVYISQQTQQNQIEQPETTSSVDQQTIDEYEDEISALKSRVIELEMKLMEHQMVPKPSQPVETVQLNEFLETTAQNSTVTHSETTVTQTSATATEPSPPQIDTIENAEIMFQQRLYQQPVEQAPQAPPPIQSS